MQWKGNDIAILAQDGYEAPELWEILWRAILAGDDRPDAACCLPSPHRGEQTAHIRPGDAVHQRRRIVKHPTRTRNFPGGGEPCA